MRFMKKALKRHGSPEAITTYGLRSYGAAMEEPLLSSIVTNEPEAAISDESFNRTGYWSHSVKSCVVNTRLHRAKGAASFGFDEWLER